MTGLRGDIRYPFLFQSLAEHGMICPESCRVLFTGDFPPGGVLFDRLLAQTEKEARPTAILVHNDPLALALMRRIHERGYSVPGDFSVIANSEVPSAAHCKPPLTTVARDFDGYAREVLAGLEELFQGRPFGVRRVPSLLIERGSVRNLNFSASSTSEKRS